ncbi:hypothetical protein IFM89_028834 [Coptis chinensis]|uniref:Beta-galactosidase n=1 Tax=Coptis chinensis TaxID=261450 RepID=A0A835H9G7_9MAGN|nr:hypothetical protein IFM89_028834 [Coptis chinensis]
MAEESVLVVEMNELEVEENILVVVVVSGLEVDVNILGVAVSRLEVEGNVLVVEGNILGVAVSSLEVEGNVLVVEVVSYSSFLLTFSTVQMVFSMLRQGPFTRSYHPIDVNGHLLSWMSVAIENLMGEWIKEEPVINNLLHQLIVTSTMCGSVCTDRKALESLCLSWDDIYALFSLILVVERGFPYWLREVSNITFRTDNPPFKLENEYNNIQRVYKENGMKYVQWAGNMAVRLKTGVPWVMCKQKDAPDPVLVSIHAMGGTVEILLLVQTELTNLFFGPRTGLHSTVYLETLHLRDQLKILHSQLLASSLGMVLLQTTTWLFTGRRRRHDCKRSNKAYYRVPVAKAPAGSWVLIEGVEVSIMKTSTPCNVKYDEEVYILRPLLFIMIAVHSTQFWMV